MVLALRQEGYVRPEVWVSSKYKNDFILAYWSDRFRNIKVVLPPGGRWSFAI